MNRRFFRHLALVVLIASASVAYTQRTRPVLTPTLGLEHGVQEFVTPDFTLKLVKDSQTAAGLLPKDGKGFDFTPSDRLDQRSGDGFYHLGDITFRARVVGSSDWIGESTAAHRHPVKALDTIGPTISAAILTDTLSVDCPLLVVRRWVVANGKLQLLFDIQNTGTKSVEIGALGIPMPFNNILTGRSLEQAHAICSFSDPYIGEDGGYLQVTRLTGTGPTMVVTPVGKTPFEAYRPLNEPMRREQTFEGVLEWTVYSKAYADNEWKGVQQWNTPTETTIKPGETRTYGVQFQPSDSIRHIEKTLTAVGRPVAVGIPGYVLPMDLHAKLFLKYGSGVRSVQADPAGSIVAKPNRDGKSGWRGYDLQSKSWGRARLNVTYQDGTRQTINYYVTKPAAQAVADLGHFLTTKSWFTDATDPFDRAPSAISYDREANHQVVQDSRVWIAGLGDEAGSGSWLAAFMKELAQPTAEEVGKLEQFVDKVLWGNLQFKDGPKKYGVRKSVFYHDPKLLPNFLYDPALNWTSWTSWNKQATDDIGRGYNYSHVVSAYWAMYRIARKDPEMVKSHPWQWFLTQAYETTKYLTSVDANGDDVVGYWRLGMMEGDIFMSLLEDLRTEGWTSQADLVEARMRQRAARWSHEAYPFGSEMAWDSTGQEEVYAWCKYFGFEDKAQVSLNSILAYMPTIPHWGYNGNARRYWDFLYGGKLTRIERQIHHYGSGLNAIPVLHEYRQHPDDLYLLRVGYGGTMGGLSNIDQEGFASAAFHSFPQTLKWDAYSGDYGPNFFGDVFNAATYLVNSPDFGWQSFGGNLSRHGSWIRVEPKDSLRRRIYIAPAGLYLTLDYGHFVFAEFNVRTGHVVVTVDDEMTVSRTTEWNRLKIEQPAAIAGVGRYRLVDKQFKVARGAYLIPSSYRVELAPDKAYRLGSGR